MRAYLGVLLEVHDRHGLGGVHGLVVDAVGRLVVQTHRQLQLDARRHGLTCRGQSEMGVSASGRAGDSNPCKKKTCEGGTRTCDRLDIEVGLIHLSIERPHALLDKHTTRGDNS